MREGFALWANPSSPHAEGRRARAALEDARARIKAALGWDGELIFTSGASEALAIAILQSAQAAHRRERGRARCRAAFVLRMPLACPVDSLGLVDRFLPALSPGWSRCSRRTARPA